MVVGFDDLKFESEIAGELKRLRSLEIVRLVDVVVVAKSKGGELVPVKAGELSQEDSAQFGAIVGALVGLEDGEQGEENGDNAGNVLGFVGDDQTWSVPDAIPAGSLAVVALIEHRWAIPIRDAVARAGGRLWRTRGSSLTTPSRNASPTDDLFGLAEGRTGRSDRQSQPSPQLYPSRLWSGGLPPVSQNDPTM